MHKLEHIFHSFVHCESILGTPCVDRTQQMERHITLDIGYVRRWVTQEEQTEEEGLTMDISFEDGKRLWSLMWNKEELITRKRRFLMGSLLASTSEGSQKKFKRPKFLSDLYLLESFVRNDEVTSKSVRITVERCFACCSCESHHVVQDYLQLFQTNDGENSCNNGLPLKQLTPSLHNTPTSSLCLSSVSNMLVELDKMSYQELAATSRKLRGVSLVPQFPPARCTGNRDLLIERVKKRFNKLLSKLKDGDALPEPLVKALSIIYLSYKHRSRHIDMLTSELYPFPRETVGLHNDIINALWLLPKVKHDELKALHTLLDPKIEVPVKCFRNALRKYLIEYLFECSETSITEEALKTIDFINRKMQSQTLVFSKETIEEEVEAVMIMSRQLKQIISRVFSGGSDDARQCFKGFGNDKNIDSFSIVGTDYFMRLGDNENGQMYSSCSNYEAEATGDSGPGISTSFTTSSDSFFLTGTANKISGNNTKMPEVEHDDDIEMEKLCIEESEKLTPERTSQNTGSMGVKSVQEICDETALVAYKLIGSMLDKLIKTEGLDADMSTRIYLNGGSLASADLQGAMDMLKTSKEQTRSRIFVQTVEELVPSLTERVSPSKLKGLNVNSLSVITLMILLYSIWCEAETTTYDLYGRNYSYIYDDTSDPMALVRCAPSTFKVANRFVHSTVIVNWTAQHPDHGSHWRARNQRRAHRFETKTTLFSPAIFPTVSCVVSTGILQSPNGNKKRRVRALVVLMGCICSKGISRDGETHRAKSLKRFLTLSKKGVVVAARIDVASNGNPMDATQDNAVTNSLPPLVAEREKTAAGGGLQRRVTLNAGANRDSSEAVGVPNEVEGSLEIVDVPNGFSGEHVAAGWPSWLTAVAAEAIDGWIPRKASSFEKLDKIGQGTYSNVYRARDLESGKIVALKKVRFVNMDPESVRFMAREIHILRRLDHPNVIKLEGIVTSRMSCNLYLVFEYMEHDLAGLAARPGPKFTEPQVEQLHKIFKLCGSPSDEYWKKSKLPHATIFKPQHQYRRCVAETFEDFPSVALTLLDSLLAVEPANRGTAASALKSAFFKTKPFACNPSSLPKYPPSKEYDAKLRDEEIRRQRAEATKKRSESARPGRQEIKTKPVPDVNVKQQKRQPQANPKTSSEKYNAQYDESRSGFSIDPPVGTAQNGFYHPGMHTGGFGSSFTKEENQEEPQVPGRPYSSMGAANDPRLQTQRSYMPLSGAAFFPGSAAARSTANSRYNRLDVAEPSDKHILDRPASTHKKDDRTASKGYGPRNKKIHYSGLLMPTGGNVEDMLKEHERQIQQVVRKARLDKVKSKKNF
ncbi:kinase family [Musa troglodytarum]|uniref:Kinase family n=1 Tax=Musa troglodytarum TaxID=320322 RepID=A0A9E7HXV6_9LILI|nr:kinase family [Musa troglodytarum]